MGSNIQQLKQFEKGFEWDNKFPKTGEPRLQIVDRNHTHMYKTASQDTKDLIHNVPPEDGITKILVLAMSATEYYGPNRNGDGFSEEPVKVDGQWAVKPGETLRDHHTSFEDGAHVFKHHINHDPKNKIGDIYGSVYNDYMHRVELLAGVNHEKANRTVEKVNDGEFPAVSMGCRIPYDVCNICGNKAPQISDYCKHVSGDHPEFGMNTLMDDGRKCFVWNPSPDLFDLSIVSEPADEIGWMMKKVAHQGHGRKRSVYPVKLSAKIGAQKQELSKKKADLAKISEIEKVISGQIADTSENDADESRTDNECGCSHNEKKIKQFTKNIFPKIFKHFESLDEPLLKDLSGFPLTEIFSTLNNEGILPTTGEIFSILSHKKGVSPNKRVIRVISTNTPSLIEGLKANPGGLSDIEQSVKDLISPTAVNKKIASKVQPYREKRGLYEDHLMRKYVPEEIGTPFSEITGISSPEDAYYSSTLEPLNYRDPQTGDTYQTNRRAAEKADLENKKKLYKELAGTAAALGLGVKTLTANNKLKWLSVPMAGLGAKGVSKVKDTQETPQTRTEEGVDVPVNTEFMKKNGSKIEGGTPLLSVLIGQEKMASTKNTDYNKRVRRHIQTWSSPKANPDTNDIIEKWADLTVESHRNNL